MRLLLTAWRASTREVRILCVVLWSAGVVTLAAGAWGDTHGWWDSYGFLSNVASSATSGLFGVPFALVFFQHITLWQGDIRERREVSRMASRLASELVGDARMLCRVSGMSALRAAIREARQTLSQREEPDAEVVRQAYDLWAKLVSPPVNSQVLLSRMAASWRSMVSDVRPRLARVGGAWLDPQLITLFDEILLGALSPESELSWMEGIRHSGNDLSPSRLRQRRVAEIHLRRLEQADMYLREVERATRYADDIQRHFGRPD
jgi:hypothetical protein